MDQLKEIEFLLTSLVDVENPGAREHLIQRVLSIIPSGHNPLVYVEKVRDPVYRFSLRENFSDLLNEKKLLHDLQELMRRGEGDVDLERSSFLIGRLDDGMQGTPEDLSHRLDTLSLPLRARLAGLDEEDHQGRMDLFRGYLFHELGFRGNTENYYDPANSYIHRILETRTGIPVSLSVLSLLLARRAGLPLQGINLPGHFITRYMAGSHVIYMDPFHEGKILSREECYGYLTRQGIKPSIAYLGNASSLTIIKRMYRNLLNYHISVADVRKEKLIRKHFSVLENSSIHSFD